jgi:hypothetical protein
MKNRTLQTYLTKNWKTTLSGLISAIAAYWVIDYTLGEAPHTFKVAQWLITIGLATNGVVAKDADNNEK